MNIQLDQTVNQSGMTSRPTLMSEPARRKSEAQAKIAAEFLRLDPIFGSWFLPFWRTWTKATEDIRKLEFSSLDEYLESRVVDVSGRYTSLLSPIPTSYSDWAIVGHSQFFNGERGSISRPRKKRSSAR
jgi:hypothetical protein